MKFEVVGLGFVGLSNSVLLAQNHPVTAVDISKDRVQRVNAGQCPIIDPELEAFLAARKLSLTATTEPAYEDADFVVVATPTDYDPRSNYFDTSSVELWVAR